MQARLADVLGLHHTNSRVSLDSISSFAGSIGTKKTFKKFCNSLHQIGVTAELISQKEREILNIFQSQNAVSSNQIVDGTMEDETEISVVGNSSDAKALPISTGPGRNTLIQDKPNWTRWLQLPIDLLVGPLVLAAAETGNTKRLIDRKSVV